jgi:hypothetical protein
MCRRALLEGTECGDSLPSVGLGWCADFLWKFNFDIIFLTQNLTILTITVELFVARDFWRFLKMKSVLLPVLK